MKKLAALLAAVMMLMGFALADQTVTLPGGNYKISIPDDMTYSSQSRSDLPQFSFAYFSQTLEMDVFFYSSGGRSIMEMAEMLQADGVGAEVRQIGGRQMLCYRMTDEADGSKCIVYSMLDGGQVIEILFWYANSSAASQTEKIISGISPT